MTRLGILMKDQVQPPLLFSLGLLLVVVLPLLLGGLCVARQWSEGAGRVPAAVALGLIAALTIVEWRLANLSSTVAVAWGIVGIQYVILAVLVALLRTTRAG